MPDQPQRPVFKDGQPLGAADLDLIVDGARNRAARHERGAHTPGIVVGLELRAVDAVAQTSTGAIAVKDITVTAGIAVDAAGRQIVLAADQALPASQFLPDGGSPELDPEGPNDRTTFPHPVFLTLDERDVPAAAFGACGEAGGGGRIVEDQDIRIGRRGSQLDLDGTAAPGPGDDLGPGTGTHRILLGFVRFDVDVGRWAGVVDQVDGVRARRAGVRAGEVVTPGARLLLRAGEPLAAGQPVLSIDTAADGRLQFGKTSASGGVDDVFTVAANGDLRIKGRLFPAPEAGTLWTYSAIATDGMPLPLPAGVPAADLAAGRITVHTTITPRYPLDPGRAFLVGRCDIDADRIVHCSLFRTTQFDPAKIEAVPTATADVTVTAVLRPAANPGGTP